jgi:hypothetical protein
MLCRYSALLLLLSCTCPLFAAAQAPVPPCPERTATSAILILPAELSVTGVNVPPPLVVAIVNDDGDCAGRTTWRGDATALTIWGRTSNLPQRTVSGPLAPGDTLHMRLYRSSRDSTYVNPEIQFRSGPAHLTDQPVYQPNGIYVVDAVHLPPPLTAWDTPD